MTHRCARLLSVVVLSDDDRALLKVTLRARPAVLAEWQELARANLTAPGPAMENLLAHGFVTVDAEGTLTFADPAEILQGQLRADLRLQQAQLSTATERLLATARDLTGFLDDSTIGGRSSGTLDLEFVHGPEAPRDASTRLVHRRGPVTSCAVLPDASRLEAPPPEFLDQFIAMMRSKPVPDRVLLGPHEQGEEQLSAPLSALQQAGAQFRIRADLPSWFAVDADDYVALPVAWGDPWPTSVVLLRHPGLAGAMRHLFELLWTSAPPRGQDDPSWLPLVQLLATGATTSQAASTLGISERTARRRVDEAMRHHRARTMFELGVAVIRNQRV